MKNILSMLTVLLVLSCGKGDSNNNPNQIPPGNVQYEGGVQFTQTVTFTVQAGQTLSWAQVNQMFRGNTPIAREIPPGFGGQPNNYYGGGYGRTFTASTLAQEAQYRGGYQMQPYGNPQQPYSNQPSYYGW
jgi:hypothetical protein